MTQLLQRSALRIFILPAVAAIVCTAGCSSRMDRLDRHVDALLEQSTDNLGGNAVAPTIQPLHTQPIPRESSNDPYATELPTSNPAAADLPFEPAEEAERLTARLYADPRDAEDAISLDLNQALMYAVAHSREYRFFEEDFVLAGLRLLIERHQWGPRFFNDTTAAIEGFGDDGFFDTSLRVINELSVTQRLPYGGQVAATALAQATEDLHRRVAYSASQSADIILSAQIPLLRGAGMVARENRIQAERNLIYTARDFEQFRREFLFDITNDFLALVVRSQSIENAQRQVESLEWFEERSRAFVETGRETPLDLALAQQATLDAVDTLNNQRELYRLAVDRFKVRLGIPSDRALVIIRSDPGLPVPDITLDEAVARAMAYRLDLQTQRDRLDDARRSVANARNDLLPDLDVFGSFSMGTDPGRRRGGIDFEPDNADFDLGITLGLPLDREIERANLRQAQIDLERAVRSYEQFRDTLAVETRSAVREVDRAIFSLRIQEENVRIAERGQEAIEADPDRTTARDRTEAVDRLLRARDQRDAAYRDLQIAILAYLLNSGQLRVAPDGTILPLRGMELADQQATPVPEPAMDPQNRGPNAGPGQEPPAADG